MPAWYYAFTVALALLWLFATPRDRSAAGLVFAATLLSHLLFHTVSVVVASPWKLAVAGTVDFATLFALVVLRTGPAGYLNAAALLAAWLAHALCFYDLLAGTDLVYSRYETLLEISAAMQVLAFHDTLGTQFRRLAACFPLHARGDGSFRRPVPRAADLHHPRDSHP